MVPRRLLDEVLIYKEETEADARQYVVNQYPDGVGYHELMATKASDAETLFSSLESQELDVILMDNFMDLAAKLLVWDKYPEYKNSPIFLNLGFFKNEATLAEQFSFLPFLTPTESAQNHLKIYRWLRAMQPKAKIYFLCYHFCSSVGNHLRYNNAREFYREFESIARNEDIHIIPPLTVGAELTKGEEDWPHFQPPVYQALAGYIYLNTVSDLPKTNHPYRLPPSEIA